MVKKPRTLSENLKNGKNILNELLTGKQFLDVMGRPKQLRSMVQIGMMERGKTTLARYANKYSNADVKVLWDDVSRYKINQIEMDFLTSIRHIWEDQTILLIINAHSFYKATKAYREIVEAMIFVSFPPPWEIYSDIFLDKMFAQYGIQPPEMAHTGLILWRNWATNKVEWGWLTWSDIKEYEVEWDFIYDRERLLQLHEEQNESRMPVPKIANL